MQKNIDCILCGSCVADILCRPVSLDVAIGGLGFIEVELPGGGTVDDAKQHKRGSNYLRGATVGQQSHCANGGLIKHGGVGSHF